MFGYVVPNQAALSDEAQKRYRTAYCGLCRRIDALHGLRGRFTLSYDLTFLNLLLCSLYEGETEASSGHDRCPIHPLGGVEWRAASPTDYCADLSVALHYYNAEDKWKDDRSLLGLGYEKLLTGCKQAAESRWPRQCSAIRTCLDRLAEYEAAGSEDLDAVSGCFGELMAELFDYRQDHWSPELRSIGFHLGKFIYLLDAYDDLEHDYLDEIDAQVRRYTRAATQKIENLTSREQNVRGDLDAVLTALSHSRRADGLTDRLRPVFQLYEQSYLSEKSLWYRKRPGKRSRAAAVLIEENETDAASAAQAAALLHSEYGRAAVAACVQGWLGDRDTCLSADIPLENDRDYVMSLLAVLSGGSRRAAYQVEELGGSVCENGYSIPKVQFSRKENEK